MKQIPDQTVGCLEEPRHIVPFPCGRATLLQGVGSGGGGGVLGALIGSLNNRPGFILGTMSSYTLITFSLHGFCVA